MDALFEILFIFLLIVANGVFALAEIAIVSARKPRLNELARQGSPAAQAALDLATAPDRFLSTVQIGITLVGILAGAFGGATLATELAEFFSRFEITPEFSQAMAVSLVVLAITYLSLVIGELVPKRLGLNAPEKIACLVARPMTMLSKLASPAVAVLGASSRLVLWAIRARPSTEPAVTEEEVKIMIEQGAAAGVFEHAEREIVGRVFEFADQTVRSLMTRHGDIVWLNTRDPIEVNVEKIRGSPHSYFPVADGRLSRLQGLASLKCLWAELCAGRPQDISKNLSDPLYVPVSMPAISLLEQFKASGRHIAMAVDEFGGIAGIVTIHDVLTALIGDMPHDNTPGEQPMVHRPDGSWLVDGMVSLDVFQEKFKSPQFPTRGRTEYSTVGGFVMMHLGRIPKPADRFEWGGFRFEVLDMDGNRVDKIMVVPLASRGNPDPRKGEGGENAKP
jgi:putative hemolysin